MKATPEWDVESLDAVLSRLRDKRGFETRRLDFLEREIASLEAIKERVLSGEHVPTAMIF